MLPLTILAPYCQTLIAMSLFQESAVAEFNDLGTLLLGGFASAIGVALVFTFIKLRLRDKRPRTADFITIAQPEDRK
jgi:hypothetical protein